MLALASTRAAHQWPSASLRTCGLSSGARVRYDLSCLRVLACLAQCFGSKEGCVWLHGVVALLDQSQTVLHIRLLRAPVHAPHVSTVLLSCGVYQSSLCCWRTVVASANPLSCVWRAVFLHACAICSARKCSCTTSWEGEECARPALVCVALCPASVAPEKDCMSW